MTLNRCPLASLKAVPVQGLSSIVPSSSVYVDSMLLKGYCVYLLTYVAYDSKVLAGYTVTASDSGASGMESNCCYLTMTATAKLQSSGCVSVRAVFSTFYHASISCAGDHMTSFGTGHVRESKLER